MKRYNYHCIDCRKLILASDKPAEAPNTCWECQDKWEKKQTKVSKSRFEYQVQHEKAKIKRGKSNKI